EESAPAPGFYSMDRLTINTNDERVSFLVLSIHFELYEKADEAAMLDKEPIIRDAMSRLIGRRSTAELRRLETRGQLKQEIGIMVNEILQKNAVTSIHFSEFLVQ
ncbi:flagellar basal body-associated FliL family protein, partial [Arthrospira platensis SPKY1]|nr:flagellar basal body-associated FliL family protein [Arthrospira platensis SPKY1]